MNHANNSPLRHAEKIAFVTRGSRGIGAAIVRRLAADGAVVVFTYAASEERALALVAEVQLLAALRKPCKPTMQTRQP